jgi:thiosulfate reductase/polysulfide reductase chain A
MFIKNPKLSRRRFLAAGGVTAAALTVGSKVGVMKAVAASDKPKTGKGKTEHIHTCCAICVNKCALTAEVKDGVIRKLNPNPKFFKSRGMLCARGNAGAKIPYDPDRIKYPMMRVGERGEGKWKRISWDEAFDFITEKVVELVKEEENRSTIAFASTEGLQEEYFVDLANIIGSLNTVRHPTLCLASNIQGYSSVYGTFPDADIENSKFVVMAGSNRAEAFITPDTIDIATKRKEQTLVCIDPRATKTTAVADKWYPIKPGTDLALVLTVINYIISNDLHDQAFCDEWTVGFDQLKESVKRYTVSWCAKETEIAEDEIVWLATEFAKNAPASVWYPGRRSSFYGNDVYYRRAIAILNAIVGAWDKPGGLVPKAKVPLKKQEIVFPFFDWSMDRIDKGKLPFIGGIVPEDDKTDAGLPDDSCVYLSEKDGSWPVFREAILNKKPYPVRGMFVYKQNPMESVPNRAKTLEMIKKLDFICTIDIIMSDTAFFSDIVLPESTYLERWDPAKALAGIRPVVVFRQPVIETLHDTKPMFDIMCKLSHRLMDRKDFWDDTEPEDLEYFREQCLERLTANPVKSMIELQMSGHPGGLEKLYKDGCFWIHDENVYGTTFKKGKQKTRSGKIEIFSQRYLDKGLKPLPEYTPQAEPKPDEFRFVVGRHGQFTHAKTQNVMWLLEAYGDPDMENAIWINTKVARKRGLQSGDRVKVKSRVGEQEIKVLATEFIREDTVFYLHGFGRLSQGLTNIYGKGASNAAILEDYIDTISGNAALHETFVTIEKV